MQKRIFSLVSGLCCSITLAALPVTASASDESKMSFFITSVGVGNGADLGGLEGADKHCTSLATTVGADNRTWRAYLSTQGQDFKDTNVVNARDRIGSGPWYNAKGVVVANSVDELHSSNNNLNKETALDENGKIVNGRTEKPNKHDILTGSRVDGTSFGPQFFTDMTCNNWTSSGEGKAMLGHHDRLGPIDHAWAKSWNSAHISKGCSQEALKKTGGDALFYCFATD
ncbi:hypothetical protein ACFL1S_02360 [Pseudomonadota bacterium]